MFAAALLFPIDWPEPFGLVMIEAMARGTPMIAYCCGSVPEIIEDGVTGFMVDDLEAAVRVAAHPDLEPVALPTAVRSALQLQLTVRQFRGRPPHGVRRLFTARLPARVPCACPQRR
jgi:glycosyltransferase involved in cell wall biosynthesis